MSDHLKENTLLKIQYKLNKLKSEMDFFTRNKWKTIGIGVLISAVGPSYNSTDFAGRSRNALELSGGTYLELVISVAVFYSLVVTTAHFVWKYRDQKKLKFLEKRKKQLEEELKTSNLL